MNRALTPDRPRDLPHDPALPQMATALDEQAMAGRFAAVLGAASAHELLACRVDHVKYRPGRNLAVSYVLTLRARAGVQVVEQRVAARFCSAGESARRHLKATLRGFPPSPAGPALTHLRALDMSAHWWPNDAKLAAAASLADQAAMRERWLPEVAAAAGQRSPIVRHRLEIVQVVPEHRVTARARLDLANGQHIVAYAKADAEQGGPATHALMTALAASPARRDGRLLTPRPLLWQAASGLHWQAALPGVTLDEQAPQVAPADAEQVGALLAALHATRVAGLASIPVAALRRRPIEVADALSGVRPVAALRVQSLAMALVRKIDFGLALPPVTLHGDLHPRNLLQRADGRLSLIDLDGVHRGPALLDLGAWLADGLYRALLEGRDPASALNANRAFLRGYVRGGAPAHAAPALAWATAYQLLCQRVWRGVVTLKPGRAALIEPLLTMAQRVLDAGHVDAAAEPCLEAA